MEIYDPVANRWQARATALSDFYLPRAVQLRDGRVVVSASQGIVDVYTPSTDTWAHLPSPSAGSSSFTLTHEQEGRIYALDVHGGNVYHYTLATGMWGTGTSGSHGLDVVSDARGRVHMFGRYSSPSDVLTPHNVYTPSSDTWSVAAPLPAGYYSSGYALGEDERIYMAGGALPAMPVWTTSNRFDVLDPVSDTVTSLAPMPTTRCRLAATRLPGGRILVTGGIVTITSVPISTNTTLVYTIATNTWR